VVDGAQERELKDQNIGTTKKGTWCDCLLLSSCFSDRELRDRR